MILCYYNPQLLNHKWAVELVQQLGGNIDNGGWTALMRLFIGYVDKTDFGSFGFKSLWKKEKNINISGLQKWMCKKSELMGKVVAAVPDAMAYY